jgi:hypothetical protein
MRIHRRGAESAEKKFFFYLRVLRVSAVEKRTFYE